MKSRALQERLRTANLVASSAMSGPFFRVLRMDPFPPRRRVSMQFAAAISLVNGALNVIGTEQVYSLNSLFDPDNSGGAVQPYGFDTLASVYNKYKVRSVLVEATCNSGSTAGPQWIVNMVEPSGTTLSLTGGALNTFLDKPFTHVVALSGGGNQQTVKYRQIFNIAQIDGLTPTEFDANVEEYAATVTADPSRMPLLRMASVGGDSVTAQVTLRLTYDAEFFDRKILAQS